MTDLKPGSNSKFHDGNLIHGDIFPHHAWSNVNVLTSQLSEDRGIEQ